MPMPKITPEAKRIRFWKTVIVGDGCWKWDGCTRKDGRGTSSYGRYRQMLAHRLAWTLTYGPIPEGMNICHHCDNPICVRPDHLFLGTQADNVLDMREKNRGRIPAPRQGSRHHKAKLTDSDVLAIRDAYRGGENAASIKTRYTVSLNQICLVINRQNWTHLP